MAGGVAGASSQMVPWPSDVVIVNLEIVHRRICATGSGADTPVAASTQADGFHSVNIPTRPSLNTMRIFLKSVAMRSCE
jgi:hypothetical protein